MLKESAQEEVLFKESLDVSEKKDQKSFLDACICASWETIPVLWPLDRRIASNPLEEFEAMRFEDAMLESASYFERKDIPKMLEAVNRQTIKWCQALFDEKQSILKVPAYQSKKYGLYKGWLRLAIYDGNLHQKFPKKIHWLKNLPETAEKAIEVCLKQLSIPYDETQLFLRLILTTLPGWAGYVKYIETYEKCNYPTSAKNDFLAIRIVIISLMWTEAVQLIAWHKDYLLPKDSVSKFIKSLRHTESLYRKDLLSKLKIHSSNKPTCFSQGRKAAVEGQFVFCIDSRSESLRQTLEKIGPYETFGTAGFFGLPLSIQEGSERKLNSCPVFVSPKYTVAKKVVKKHFLNQWYLCLRENTKATLFAPFVLVEFLAPLLGLSFFKRTFTPTVLQRLKFLAKKPFRSFASHLIDENCISFQDQCLYAHKALTMMGLSEKFSPIVVVCAHGSVTKNNPFASLLQCGACGGNEGSFNAQVLCKILNTMEVRKYLAKNDIIIPNSTCFLAAFHDTTSNQISFCSEPDFTSLNLKAFQKIKRDLSKATQVLNVHKAHNKSKSYAFKKAYDWSEVQPEWGLSRNASLIIAPRFFTQSIDLKGRAFLHTYNWEEDKDGSILNTLLEGPLLVAHGINAQYFFSTLNNVAYGAGSKVTKNITGQRGPMQGNASDLMFGLPRQSVFLSDEKIHHIFCRLNVFIHAPTPSIKTILLKNKKIQELIANEWIYVVALDPVANDYYLMNSSLSWEPIEKLP